MRVLLIGFGPFPGAPRNPSALLAKALARRRRPAFGDIVRASHIFTTTYAAVDRDLAKFLAAPADIVLIETRARNAVSLFPDASGYRPQRRVIAPGGPAALRGAAPFARLLGAVRMSAVPSRLSRDAGRYLCNYAYWRALEQAHDGRPLVQFVHIPRVLFGARRLRPGRRTARLGTLVAASERLLIALIAASRR